MASSLTVNTFENNITNYNWCRDMLMFDKGYTRQQLFGHKLDTLESLFWLDCPQARYKVTKSKRDFVWAQIDRFMRWI